MEKITINNQELTIAFNFATELAYEDLTGKAFSPVDIIPEKGQEPKASDFIKIALACIIANNPDSPIDSDYILHKATRKEVTKLITLTIREMMAWITVPAIAEEHVPEPSDEKEEEGKNA